MAPLSRLPYLTAYVVLTLAFVALLSGTMLLATRGLARPDALLLTLAVVASLPMADAFVEAQTTIPMMVFVAAADLTADTHPRLAGLFAALAFLRYQTAIGALGGLLLVRPRLIPAFGAGVLLLAGLGVLLLGGHPEVMLPGIRYGIGGFLSAPFSIPGVAGRWTWPLDGLMFVLSVATAWRVRSLTSAAMLAGSVGWVAVSPFVYMHDLALTPLLTALLLVRLSRGGVPMVPVAIAGALLYVATETAVGSLVVLAEFGLLAALWTVPAYAARPRPQAGATAASIPSTSL